MIRNCWFKLAVIVVCVGLNIGLPTLHSFEELAKHHCQGFDVEMMYRLASGTLAEKYGMKYASLDCYIRQFVNKDGQDQWHSEEED